MNTFKLLVNRFDYFLCIATLGQKVQAYNSIRFIVYTLHAAAFTIKTALRHCKYSLLHPEDKYGICTVLYVWFEGILKIMGVAVQSKLVLLCGFVVTLGLLQGIAADGCSSEAFKLNYLFVFDCPSYDLPIIYDNSSCRTGPRDISEHRRTFSNCTFDSGLASVYILINLIPLMIYFPLLILFNFNLASGPAQSFIFFYQALPAAIPLDQTTYVGYTLAGGFISSLIVMQNPITGLLFPRTLPYLRLQYCNLVAVMVAVIVTLVLVKCIDCPCTTWRRPWAKLRRSVRHFRNRRAWKGTVLNGLCSIATLTYGFVIQQSFTVLQPTKHCLSGAKYCAYYCNEWNYTNTPEYRPFIAGALVSLVLVLPLPLLLLYYPCVPALMQRITKRSSPFATCHKLAPVFDVFQSAYKPKLRFFAAFPLLYRFVIWMLFSILSVQLPNERQLMITFVFILILAIHCLVQPYSKPRHNYIETLYLVNLVLISIMLTFTAQFDDHVEGNSHGDHALFHVIMFLPVLLALLPMLFSFWYFIWKRKCCKKCRAACCKIRVHQNRNESAEDEAAQLPMSEAYLDMSELIPKEPPEL